MTLRQLFRSSCAGAALAILGCGPDPAPDTPPETPETVTSATNSPPVARPERYATGAAFNPNGRLFIGRMWNASGSTAVETLPEIHARYVTAFIEEPGFGGGRRMVRFDYTPPSQWQEIVPDDGDLPPVPPDPKPNPNSPEARGRELAMKEHAIYQRSLDVVAFNDGTRKYATERSWNLGDRYLIGLANGETKVLLHTAVNLHQMMKFKTNPNESARKSMPTRDLDAFEKNALEMLKAGDEIVAETQPHRMRMLGAIRARQDCLSCHSQSKVGDLLGAFTYTLAPVSQETPATQCLHETEGLTAVEMTAIEALQKVGATVVRNGTEPIREVRFSYTGRPATAVPPKDTVLVHLRAFPELTTLDVSKSLVTDAGIAEITKRKNLKTIDVTYCGITAKGIEELKKAIPGLKVVSAPQQVSPAAP